MNPKRWLILAFMAALALVAMAPGQALAATDVPAGDEVTFKGQIEAGKKLYVVVTSDMKFAPKDTQGVNEIKSFKKDAKKFKFKLDSRVPVWTYIITDNPGIFGKVVDKKFGGPSFMSGLYSTTMYKLSKWDKLGEEAKTILADAGIKTEDQWNFFLYMHEKKSGINTVLKEGSHQGKIVIFARSVLTDHAKSNNYWDEGTKIALEKDGKFTASFKTFRNCPPDTPFKVFVNGKESADNAFTVKGNGWWLDKGYIYMNPIWIIIGAILVGTYFSMIGAAGGMLMAAFQVIVVGTSGPVGINAANVLRPSNMALTLFSPLGSFYRYAVVERRVAWPVGISFGVGILIGSIWLGKYVTQYLPLKSYKEWLAVLVVLMGIQTLYELSPKMMEKRKNIKAMVKKFNEEVAKAKAEGRAAEMGRIEPVKGGLTDYRFKFWGEEFTINPLLFGLLGLAIGIVSRSFGIGGGFLLVPAMTTLGGLPMYVAVPISLIGTCFSSVGAFLGYLMNGYLPDLTLAVSIIIGGFVGGMLGSRAQKLFSEKVLKVVLAITLFFLFFRFFKIEIWI